MPIHDIQSSFAAGELAPAVQARVDLAKYKSGCGTLRNFIVSPHGSIYNRPGTYFVHATKDSSKTSRLVPFIFSTGDAFVLEFGDQYIRFYKNGGIVLTAGLAVYELATPYAAADISSLKFAQSADTFYVAHVGYKPQVIQRVADNNWTIGDYNYTRGPFMLANTDASKTMTYSGGNIVTSAFNYFVSGHVGALFRLNVSNNAQTDSGTITNPVPVVTDGTGISTGAGQWNLVTSGTWHGTISVQKSLDGGTTWATVWNGSSNSDTNFNQYGSEPLVDGIDPCLIRIEYIGFLSGGIFVAPTGTINYVLRGSSFIREGIVKVTAINTAQSAAVSVVKTPTASTATTDWAEGSWSPYRGWPRVVGFFQDRLVWGSTQSEPQTEWLTKTSDYIDFGVSDPLEDDDSVSVNLIGRQLNPIRSILMFLSSCIAFTDSVNWTTGSNSGGAITPSTVFVKLQGSRGSNTVDPVLIGNRVIFVEPRGSTVRDMVYEYFTDTFNSDNIGLLSKHLFDGYTVTAMAYQQAPDSLLWVLRSDGVLLCLTYLREQEMLAWSRHDTNGSVESISVIPTTGYDELWMIVNRNGNRYVERLSNRTTSTDPADQYFVDCGISYSGQPTATLTGYDHLNGMTVTINGEGFVLPPQIVQNGTVTLDKARSKAHVGLSYTYDIGTLHPEVPMQDGTSQGRKYQINRCVIRFLNSRGGFMGQDAASATRPVLLPNAINDPLTPDPLFTGFYPATLPQGGDPYGAVFFRGTDPMPVTILSILPLVEMGESV